MDPLQLAFDVAFFAVFAIVVLRYVADRTPVNRDVVFVFATVAVLIGVSLLRRVVPEFPSWPSSAMLLAQPLLILRLTRHFRLLDPRLHAAAVAGFVASVALIVLRVTNGSNAALLAVVGYFVVIEIVGASLLGVAARDRIGNARLRLAIAAISSLCFAVSILIVGVAAVAAPIDADGTRSTVEPAITLGRLFALLAGLGYLLAFLPPRALRRVHQRAIAFDLADELVSAPTGTAPGALWEGLATAALRVTSARAAIVVTGSPVADVQAVAGHWADAPASGDQLRVGESDGETMLESLLARSGARETVVVPLASDVQQIGWLVAFTEGGSLFVEDDRALLALLGAQTVRAVEREEAIRERATLEGELNRTTDELEQSRLLLESEARFRVALEAHPRPILVTDETGRIAYANAQAESAFGYRADELREMQLGDLIPVAAAVEHTNGHREAAVSEGRDRSGRRFPVELATREFEYEGQRQTIAVVEDIGERLEIEQLREKFIGVLSHELRTPVTAIYGGTQLLLSRSGQLDEATEREILTDVTLESERLHRLIENTLVLARIERGRELEGADPVLLQRLLPTVLQRERGLWPDTKISLVISTDLPTAKGDEGYLGQVVRNLVSNAAKYARGNEIEVEARAADGGVEVRVLDRGPGIDAETADLLFDLYYREPSLSGMAPGAGIGLFVCRQIVHALGGRIWAAPRAGGGAEFGFFVPGYDADEEMASEMAGQRRLAAGEAALA